MGRKKAKANYRRTTMRLPDLDHCKLAVINSLASPASRRVYLFAMDQFIAWYCSLKTTPYAQSYMLRKGMQGGDQQQTYMFSYLSQEARVRKDHGTTHGCRL
jgi:hypothetical protein